MTTLPLRDGTVDLDTGGVTRASGNTRLSKLQLRLLRVLASHTGPVSRGDLLEAVWGPGAKNNSLGVMIHALRQRLEVDPSNPDHVIAVHRQGFAFRPWGGASSATLSPAGRLDLGFAKVDWDSFMVHTSDGEAALTAHEAALLRVLVDHDGAPVSRTVLLTEVWGASSADTRAVDHAIARLRTKIEEDAEQPRRLRTVRGVGYRLQIPGQAPKLPYVPRTLVGRDSLMDAVDEGLQTTPWITLTGAGGVGKTTIALQVAHRRAPKAVFVDLSAVREGSAVHRAVANALGISTPGQLLAQIALSVATKRLVVLDNCEQLSPGALNVLHQVFAHEGVPVVATSRIRLGLREEQVWPVEPLDDDEASFLLHRRASQVHRGIERSALQALVPALDGLPLAIELAAVQLRHRTPEELRRSLMGNPAVLQDSRVAEDRHSAMNKAIAWSWTLLAPPQQHALCVLGGFEASVSYAVASAVLVEGMLDVLVEHHLVAHRSTKGGTRFHLPSLIRGFVREQTTDRQEVSTTIAHALVEVFEPLVIADLQHDDPGLGKELLAVPDLVWASRHLEPSSEAGWLGLALASLQLEQGEVPLLPENLGRLDSQQRALFYHARSRGLRGAGHGEEAGLMAQLGSEEAKGAQIPWLRARLWLLRSVSCIDEANLDEAEEWCQRVLQDHQQGARDKAMACTRIAWTQHLRGTSQRLIAGWIGHCSTTAPALRCRLW